MKKSPWFLGSVLGACLVALAFAWAAFSRPGQLASAELAGGEGKPLFLEAKKRAEAMQAKREKIQKEIGGLSGLSGQQGQHRVFVSAQLVYLPDSPEPVQPLNLGMKTEDGIEVGWKIKYGFDPADPGVAAGDPDGDGFTNFEEFVAQPQTDPMNKQDSPAKESKLKSRSGEPVAMAVSFPEKGGGLFTLRFQVGPKRAQFKGAPGATFWILAGPDYVEVLTEEAKVQAARGKAKDSGRSTHVIPVQFVRYEEKVEKVRDEKAGGVEVEVDNSTVILERKDALAGSPKLVFSTPLRPQSLSWDVGDIRFFTPASGGTELGPFRMGETFEYEGKKFSIVEREGKKIKLLNQGESEKGALWVPPEAAEGARPGQPGET